MGTRAQSTLWGAWPFPARQPGLPGALAATVLCALALLAMARLMPVYGLSVTALLTLPLALLAWSFGLGAALIGSAFAIPAGIAVCVRASEQPLLLSITTAHLGIFFIACVTGRLRDLSLRVARELEEHARAVRLLRHNEARNQALLSALPDLIFRLDVSGKVSGASGARGRASSLRSATYIDQLFPVETAELLRERARDVLASGQPQRVEYGASEHEEPGEYEARLVQFADDQVLVIIRNVTRQKRLEHELIAAKEAALEAARSKTKFLASMSHEIRTPMNGVIGMTNLLLETPLDTEQREYAQIIQKSGEMLLTIIDDILDFAKIEAGKLELEKIEFDLVVTVEESIAAFAGQAYAKGIDLGCVFGRVPRRAVGDPARLRQVLANLLSNAVRYTDQGFVRVDVDRDDAGRITFSVGDSGPGVPAELVPRLFRPLLFGDANSAARDGTGLGLSIAHELVQLMGGEIGYRPTSDGSCFHFSAQLDGDADPAAVALELRGARALLLSPGEGARRLLPAQLESVGIAPEYTSDDEAMQKWQRAQSEGQPYLALLLEGGCDPTREERALSLLRGVGEHQVPLVITLPQEARGARYDELRSGAMRVLPWPVRRAELLGCLGALQRRSEPATRATPRPEPTRLEAHVLVAEDNLVNQRVAQRTLQMLGCSAVLVDDGEKAVEAVLSQRFDVVLMDCQMPELDGYEATLAIRAREMGRRTPIVAMTASLTDQERKRCLEVGMDDCVIKPITPDQLRDTIARMITAKKDERPGAAQGIGERVQALDTRVLADLDVLGGGDPEFVVDLVRLFTEQAPRQLDAARAALDVRDYGAIAKAAHTLKSSSGYLGAKRLSELCAQLEKRANGGETSELTRMLEELMAEYDAARRELLAHIEAR
jgi:two-component system, sensor histidine kinase and response regulator